MSSALGKHSAAAAYALVMVGIGLPVWWKTTEVYRAHLPYSDIDQLAELDTRQRADVFLVCFKERSADRIAPSLQALLARSTEFMISLNVRPARPSEKKIVESSTTLEELDAMLGKELVASSPGSLALVEVPEELLPPSTNVALGSYRLLFFSSYASSEELAATVVDSVLGEPQLAATRRSLPLTATSRRPPVSGEGSKRTSGKLDLFLTLLVPQPEFVKASWDIELATDKLLGPFLESFPLEFSVKSQVLYLTPLDIPALNEGSGPIELSPDQLGLAVNSVETALASQASSAPSLNLLVYLPPVERQPLTIEGSQTASFLIPRWGGVQLYNFLNESETKFPLTLDLDMARVTGVWLSQLRSLLGVQHPDLPALPLPGLGMRNWELDFQLRQKSLQYSLETISTLTSLSHLLSQIPNIVISDEVGGQVEGAVDKVTKGSRLVKEGNLVKGFEASQHALQLAEDAFFDKSLLALLYFPEDQKYAIYIPFFLPVGIPVLLSLKTIFRFFKGELVKPKSD